MIMKSIINKTLGFAATAALWAGACLFQGCGDKDGALKSVDLRYRVEDAYERPAVNPDPIVFQVKSTDPWEIIGEAQEEGWYTISPARGEAGQTYDVTITLKENTNLDDREDLISIKSDYWTGKRFTVKQIGTAYLSADDVLVSSAGGTATIAVSTNQKWSAEVTEGTEWLRITAGASGERDGQITVSMSVNSGEQRVGEVSIYDRYDRLAWIAKCTEEGVVLMPAEPEDRSWHLLWDDAQSLEVEVESNAKWIVEKNDPKNEDWYTITGATSFDGNGKVTLDIAASDAEAVRIGKVKLSTVVEEGATPLVKYIELRQAPANKPIKMGGELSPSANQVLATGCQPGRYDVYVKSIIRYTGNPGYGVDLVWPNYSPDGTANPLRIWWRTNGLDVGDASLMKVWPGSYVYSSVVNRWGGWPNMAVGQPAKISLAFYEHRDADGNSWMQVEWWLNDNMFASLTGSINDGGAFVAPFDVLGDGANFVVSAGVFSMEKWEYTPAIDWGEYVPVELQKYPVK